MDEIAGNDRLEQRKPCRRATRFGNVRARRAVFIAVEALLAFAALHAGAAAAEPEARQVTAPALVQAPVPTLKREYLRCDRVSSQQRLAMDAAAYCSAISEELLKREFDGDFNRLLAWWRVARNAPEQ